MPSERLRVKRLNGAHEGERILRLEGPLTLTTLFDLREAIETEKPRTLIVDFRGVPYIDSAGVGLIVNIHVSCENSGRRLALVGVIDRVLTIFKAIRVDQVLTLFPSVEAAQAGLTSEG